MNYILTDHARKRCARRRIETTWIAAALDRPARVQSDPDDASLAHALWPVPERAFRVLRVIYNETVDPVAVVTAYFDDEVTDL